MAILTIGVEFCRTVLCHVRLGLMLVAVVAKVLRVLFIFMLAIDCGCSPAKLVRQQDQQENEENPFHGRDNNICAVPFQSDCSNCEPPRLLVG